MSLVSLAALTVIGMGHYHNSRGNALVQLPSKATGTVLRHDSLGISIVVVRLTLAQVAEVRVLYRPPDFSSAARGRNRERRRESFAVVPALPTLSQEVD